MAMAKKPESKTSSNANRLVTPPNPGNSKMVNPQSGLPAGAPHGGSRADVLRVPAVKDPIFSSRTPATGMHGGTQGVETQKLGPTPVGIHGPGGMHSAVKGAVSGKGATTPNGDPKGLGTGLPNGKRNR